MRRSKLGLQKVDNDSSTKKQLGLSKNQFKDRAPSLHIFAGGGDENLLKKITCWLLLKSKNVFSGFQGQPTVRFVVTEKFCHPNVWR